jgi:CTP:molybdopterin cytidylyltransferase MocA
MRGRDKLLEVIDGQSLIRRQVEMAQAATTGPVHVTLPPAPHPRHDALEGLNITCVQVPDAAQGMSASLRRGVLSLRPETPAVMILLADLPDLRTSDLRRLCAAVDLSDGTLIWRGATADGAPGHPIVFARALFDELMHLEGDCGGAEVVARNISRVMPVPLPGQRARRDLDTPEDWMAWRAEKAATRG